MSFLIPVFIPVPGGETMRLISIMLLIVGVCITAAGVLVLFLSKRAGSKKITPAWILICVGLLLTVNHSIQLVF